MTAVRIGVLFMLAAVAEIGGSWLIWQAVRESRPWWLAVGGAFALAAYGFIATAQPDSHFGRVLAAYGGVFVAGSLAWGLALDGVKPSRWDLIGAGICLFGVGVIMLAPGVSRDRRGTAAFLDRQGAADAQGRAAGFGVLRAGPPMATRTVRVHHHDRTQSTEPC